MALQHPFVFSCLCRLFGFLRRGGRRLFDRGRRFWSLLRASLEDVSGLEESKFHWAELTSYRFVCFVRYLGCGLVPNEGLDLRLGTCGSEHTL